MKISQHLVVHLSNNYNRNPLMNDEKGQTGYPYYAFTAYKRVELGRFRTQSFSCDTCNSHVSNTYTATAFSIASESHSCNRRVGTSSLSHPSWVRFQQTTVPCTETGPRLSSNYYEMNVGGNVPVILLCDIY
jgi:hypothetical protein